MLTLLLLIASDETPPVARVPAADESVYVVQERAYSKRGHVELTAFVSTPVNSRWVQAIAPMFGLTYHIRENIGIELLGVYQFNRYSSAQLEVNDNEGASPLDAELKWMEWFAGAAFQWAPFYGKIKLGGLLGDFDVYITAGFGIAGTRTGCEPKRVYRNGEGVDGTGVGVQGISEQCPDDPATATLPGGLKFAGQVGGGFRIFFSRYFGMRVEVRDIVYSEYVLRKVANPRSPMQPDDEVSTDIRHNVMFMLGLSLLI